MTIRLSKEQERFIHDAVRAGHYAREDDVIRDALDRLGQSLPKDVAAPVGKTRRADPTRRAKKPLSPDELNRRLLASGLVAQLPDPAQDIGDDDDPPIVIEGEPLSETIIRERR